MLTGQNRDRPARHFFDFPNENRKSRRRAGSGRCGTKWDGSGEGRAGNPAPWNAKRRRRAEALRRRSGAP